jgi:ABC-type multidrug transport system fused ATPase/permease subunit
MRFADPTGGDIRVGGRRLDEIPVAAWRRQIGWVSQNPHLFAGTLADNVRLGCPEASDAAVSEAIERAGAADFVGRLPHGVRTPVGERGFGLSTGQRQRIALARAFVRDAPDAPWALDSVDLDLPPGRRVAVVGPSGAGKSTLVSVLFRFLDVDRGVVTLDGVPVQDFDPDAVRRLITGCPADPHVFAGTVAENLRLARPAVDQSGLDAAAAGAGLLDWIRSLPDGWSTHLGQRGERMSGGQRQRLALARALLADPPVLVLDEPTAHLDPELRASLLDTLLTATRGRTTLVVTHDVAALAVMDEILVLDGGRVVQRGTHAELLARSAAYRQMWELDAAA